MYRKVHCWIWCCQWQRLGAYRWERYRTEFGVLCCPNSGVSCKRGINTVTLVSKSNHDRVHGFHAMCVCVCTSVCVCTCVCACSLLLEPWHIIMICHGTGGQSNRTVSRVGRFSTDYHGKLAFEHILLSHHLIRQLPYSRFFSYGSNFRIFCMWALHTKIKFAKLWRLDYVLYANAWTYQNKTYEYFQKLIVQKFAPTKISCYTVLHVRMYKHESSRWACMYTHCDPMRVTRVIIRPIIDMIQPM